MASPQQRPASSRDLWHSRAGAELQAAANKIQDKYQLDDIEITLVIADLMTRTLRKTERAGRPLDPAERGKN